MKNVNALSFVVGVILFLANSNINAQTTLISDIIDPAQQNKDILYESSDKFVGTRFLYEEFQIGTIKLVTGDVFDKLLIRYNSFDDLIHFKPMNTQKENIVKRTMIKEFSFYVPTKQKEIQFIKIRDSFYQLVASGPGYSILKKHGKKLIKGASPNGYNSGGNDTLDRLLATEEYLLYNVETYLLSDFSTKKNDIYSFLVSKKVFPDSKTAKKYIQSNSIDVKSDDGLKQLIEKDSGSD